MVGHVDFEIYSKYSYSEAAWPNYSPSFNAVFSLLGFVSGRLCGGRRLLQGPRWCVLHTRLPLPLWLMVESTVHKSASDKDIRQAYKRLSKKYHPDKNKAPDAESKFVEIARGAFCSLLQVHLI